MVLIYSKRIKPKQDNPWKFRDVVKLLRANLEWSEIRINPRSHECNDSYCDYYYGSSGVLIRNGMETKIHENYSKAVRHERVTDETGKKEDKDITIYDFDWRDCPPHCVEIKTDDVEVINFLLSKPQFSEYVPAIIGVMLHLNKIDSEKV